MILSLSAVNFVLPMLIFLPVHPRNYAEEYLISLIICVLKEYYTIPNCVEVKVAQMHQNPCFVYNAEGIKVGANSIFL